MTEKIKPCPFCGGTDAQTFDMDDGDYTAVACPNCWAWGPCVYVGEMEDLEAEAIKRWNERPSWAVGKE